MDAFSLAISIGTLDLKCKHIYLLSGIVGLFHFIMPLIGNFLGSAFLNFLKIDSHFLSGIVFFYIAILMFKDFKSDGENNFNLSLIGCIMFALSVSIDSFGIGFSLDMTQISKYISFLIFTISSGLFTFLGLTFGKLLKSFVGEYSVLIGAIIMAFLAIMNICQFLF